ncbi:YchJ family protein [Wohlfahrtiimonas chitiniclastica]|uniref:YchJ family protein n=1 Tax=Wohlfahrtiimonas chitiniclastica TaxID=400946 RepID=UPI0009EE47B2|nr:YchJ family metal-binding protein [Wohlfahrtiimonas chitiniclastica]MBS7819604.1 SEC-C domain-containing protein [Wohlfahrtiimonas chitiniclastica]
MHATPCPCQSKLTYAKCCLPFHDGSDYPTNAETLMRSRYSAYVFNLWDYLTLTWHSSTCPTDFEGSEVIQWLGLKVIKSYHDDALNEAFVEFVARYKDPANHGRADKIHELSRFVHEHERLVYIDGIFLK